MTYRCYLITNTVNRKQYVGYTKYSLITRLTAHFSKAKTGSPSTLHAAMRKYGRESFKIELLSLSRSLDRVRFRERGWIKTYNTFDQGYNMSIGGETSAPSTKVYSEVRRQKIAARTKAYWASEEGQAKRRRLQIRNRRIQSNRMKVRWANPTEAQLKARRPGRPKGSKNIWPLPFKCKPVQHNDKIYNSAKEAAVEFGVVVRTIHAWCAAHKNGWRHPWK
jgi:group I intron endonuclease